MKQSWPSKVALMACNWFGRNDFNPNRYRSEFCIPSEWSKWYPWNSPVIPSSFVTHSKFPKSGVHGSALVSNEGGGATDFGTTYIGSSNPVQSWTCSNCNFSNAFWFIVILAFKFCLSIFNLKNVDVFVPRMISSVAFGRVSNIWTYLCNASLYHCMICVEFFCNSTKVWRPREVTGKAAFTAVIYASIFGNGLLSKAGELDDPVDDCKLDSDGTGSVLFEWK